MRRSVVMLGSLCVLLVSSLAIGEDEAPAASPALRPVKTRWLQQLSRLRPPGVNERSHRAVREAFQPVVLDARRSTVRVYCNELQVAMGTVIRADGIIATKSSELEGRIKCICHDGRRYEAKVVQRSPDFDLALLQITAEDLVPVQWSDSKPIVGAWLATVGIGAEPTAIGVISAAPRRIPHPRAALGVQLDSTAEGARIQNILADSSAARARLLPGDVIQQLNEDEIVDSQAVVLTIGRYRPGDRLIIKLLRDGEPLTITAILGEFERLEQNSQADIMDSLGGPLSNRRKGFPVAIQHDTVLKPRDCGGPVVDLSGRVAGINIARASRVASYAIPAEAVQSLMSQLLEATLDTARSSESTTNSAGS